MQASSDFFELNKSSTSATEISRGVLHKPLARYVSASDSAVPKPSFQPSELSRKIIEMAMRASSVAEPISSDLNESSTTSRDLLESSTSSKEGELPLTHPQKPRGRGRPPKDAPRESFLMKSTPLSARGPTKERLCAQTHSEPVPPRHSRPHEDLLRHSLQQLLEDVDDSNMKTIELKRKVKALEASLLEKDRQELSLK